MTASGTAPTLEGRDPPAWVVDACAASAAVPARSGPCPRCVLIGMLVLVAAGLLALAWGADQPQRLRSSAESVAAARLRSAGHGWAAVRIEGDRALLVGEAPDPQSRDELDQVAPGLLDDLIGWTGAARGLDSHTTVSPCGARAHQALRRPPARFATGAHHLDPFDEPQIAELAGILADCPDWTVVVEVSRDGSALEAAAEGLLQRRAQTVSAALMLQGVARDRIESRIATRHDPQRRVGLAVEYQPGPDGTPPSARGGRD